MFKITDITVVRSFLYGSLFGDEDTEATEWVYADYTTEEEVEEYLENLNSYYPVDDYGRPFKYCLSYI